MMLGSLFRHLQPQKIASPWVGAVRQMSKYFSKAQTKRQPLNAKWAKKGYVKGKRCRPTGRHTRKGKYIIEKKRLFEIVIPDLTGFKLKPYVAKNVRKEKYGLPAASLEHVGAEPPTASI